MASALTAILKELVDQLVRHVLHAHEDEDEALGMFLKEMDEEA